MEIIVIIAEDRYGWKNTEYREKSIKTKISICIFKHVNPTRQGCLVKGAYECLTWHQILSRLFC